MTDLQAHLDVYKAELERLEALTLTGRLQALQEAMLTLRGGTA